MRIVISSGRLEVAHEIDDFLIEHSIQPKAHILQQFEDALDKFLEAKRAGPPPGYMHGVRIDEKADTYTVIDSEPTAIRHAERFERMAMEELETPPHTGTSRVLRHLQIAYFLRQAVGK